MIPYNQGKWADVRTALKQFLAENSEAPEAHEVFYAAVMCSATLGDIAAFAQDARAFRGRWPESPHLKTLALQEAMLR